MGVKNTNIGYHNRPTSGIKGINANPNAVPNGRWNWVGDIAKGTLLGPLGASALAFASQENTNKAQINLSREQMKWSEDMWNRQNAYNTPAEQMKRLRDAGLNPALMYGQGNTGNAEKALPYTQARLGNPGAAAAQAAAAGTQVSLLDSNRKLNESMASLNNIQGAVKAGEFGIAKEMSKYQMSKMQSETELNRQNVINMDTVNKLNKEYLKLEKSGYHKGNLPATLLKSVFGIDINTQEGKKTAQWLIGGMLGSKVFESLTGGVKNIFQAFKPSATINKTTTIGEIYNNK